MEMEEFENLITDLYTLIADEDAWTCNEYICSLLLRQNEQQSSSSGLVWAEVLIVIVLISWK